MFIFIFLINPQQILNKIYEIIYNSTGLIDDLCNEIQKYK